MEVLLYGKVKYHQKKGLHNIVAKGHNLSILPTEKTMLEILAN